MKRPRKLPLPPQPWRKRKPRALSRIDADVSILTKLENDDRRSLTGPPIFHALSTNPRYVFVNRKQTQGPVR
jgi:hypothetical protein